MRHNSIHWSVGILALLTLCHAQLAHADESKGNSRAGGTAGNEPNARELRSWCEANRPVARAREDRKAALWRGWCDPHGADSTVPQDDLLAPRRIWYGNYILITDLAAFGLVMGGMLLAGPFDETGTKIMVAGAGTYILGGPIVHFSKGQVGHGFGSLALRVLVPTLSTIGGALVGSAASLECRGDGGCLDGFALGIGFGLTVGVIGAAAIDNTVLAYKEVPSKNLSWSILPSYDPNKGHAGLTLSGTF